MRRRGRPPPRGIRDRPHPPSPPPPPDYYDRFDRPPPPPPGRPPPRFWDEPGPPPWVRHEFDGPPRPPPWENDYSPPHRRPPPPFIDDGPPRPPPWENDYPPPRHPPPPSFVNDGPPKPPPWQDDYPPPPHPPTFDDDDFDIPPPPPPLPPKGPLRGRERGGDGRGSNRGRGPPNGRGKAPDRGRGSSCGANQTRGVMSRGASNGRGASPARGTPRGAPGRGAPITRRAPFTSRGALKAPRGTPNVSRGTTNGSRGAATVARGVSSYRGTPNGSRGAAGAGRGAPSTSRGGLIVGASNASGASPGITGQTGVSSVNGNASKGTPDSQEQEVSADIGKGVARWLSAIRDGTIDTTGPTTTGTAGNMNSNQTAVNSVRMAGANITTPRKQNFSTYVGPRAGKPNHANNYKEKDKQNPQTSVIKAAVPGDQNFISFKNSLQECCQKQQQPVPSYTTWKNSFGYSGKVEVANNVFKSAGVQGDRKEAEQGAAYTALINLGLIDSSVKFDVKTAAAVKRPAVDNSVIHDASGKRIKLESTSPVATSYKSRLNEFCQKFRLSIPSYETEKVKDGKGFITTVVFNKKVYQSNGPQPTKKQSEQNAAQVVLHMLNQCPPPAPSYRDYIEQCRQLSSPQDQPTESTVIGASTTAVTNTTNVAVVQPNSTSTALNASTPTIQNISAPAAAQALNAAAKPTTSFTSHKNKLQEYCQKSKLEMPAYFCHRENGVFTCTVHVAGKSYTSNGCNTKKGSEQTAANVALKAMGLV